MPATRNQHAQRPVRVAPARRSHRARTPRASGTTTTVPSSSSPRPATAAPLAPATAITPQQIQEIVSSVTAEVTRRLQTVTTPVPGVDEVPSSSPSGSAASVTESPIVRISEHVATPPTAVVQLADSNALGSAHAAISGETFLAPNSSHVQPTQEYHSISLPIDCRISIKRKNKIWNDEYIDFGSLLSNPMSDNKFQLSFSSSDAGLPPSLSVFSGWMNAFRIFVGVYAQKYPHDSPALMKYRTWQIGVKIGGSTMKTLAFCVKPSVVRCLGPMFTGNCGCDQGRTKCISDNQFSPRFGPRTSDVLDRYIYIIKIN